MKNKAIKTILITLSNLNSFAQPGIENENAGNLESTDAPIGDYIIPMLLLGIALSFYLLKKRKTA